MEDPEHVVELTMGISNNHQLLIVLRRGWLVNSCASELVVKQLLGLDQQIVGILSVQSIVRVFLEGT